MKPGKVAFALIVGMLQLGLPAAARAAEACPNEALRAEARSTQLPECRAYEMVSPVYTADAGVGGAPGGYGQGGGGAPDGEAVTFTSTGAFAGAQRDDAWDWYVARRADGAGWETSWVGAPGSLQGQAAGTTLSFDLSKAIVGLAVYLPSGGAVESDLFSGDLAAAGAATLRELPAYKDIPHDLHGRRESVEAASPDFSHVVVQAEPPEPIEPGEISTNGKVMYELAGVGGPQEVLRLASVDPEGKVVRGVGVGAGFGGQESEFHAVSNDGAEIFFTKKGGGASYVRVNGSKTLRLSGSFQGASESGSKVFVRGAGFGLFMDVMDSHAGGEAITETVSLSPGTNGLYVRSSDDGRYVYFDSTGVLAANENANREMAEAGKFNLYVYDTLTRSTAFVAQALPGDELVPLINGATVEAQVSGCGSEATGCQPGRFFVFSSKARLTSEETHGGSNIYEYDALTDHLTRVSRGEEGFDQNANGASFKASIPVAGLDRATSEFQTELHEDGTRAVSDDGSTVVFTSAQALSPRAVNGQPDIYQWHEGQVSMVSMGTSLTADEAATVSPSGRDIFFVSGQGILGQDTDRLRSVYDARIGGGFPAAPVPVGGCTGDSCQGPPSVPLLLGASGSATFSGLGNPTPAGSGPAGSASKPKSKSAKCRKGYVKKKGRCVKAKKHAKRSTSTKRRGR